MSILIAFSFLTRLPMPVGREVKEHELAQSSAWFPLVRLVLGALAAGSFNLLAPFFPLTINILLTLLILTGITGALHLDGFMDTLDGLGCSGNSEKKLAVMRDSHVGAYGAAGGAFLVLFKLIALLELAQAGIALLPVLTAMAAVSRWSMVIALYKSKYPRPKGLGRAFVEYVSVREAAAATLIVTAALYFLATGYLRTLPPLLVYTLGMKQFFLLKLGGVTGDTLGFINETTEVLFLLLILLWPL